MGRATLGLVMLQLRCYEPVGTQIVSSTQSGSREKGNVLYPCVGLHQTWANGDVDFCHTLSHLARTCTFLGGISFWNAFIFVQCVSSIITG